MPNRARTNFAVTTLLILLFTGSLSLCSPAPGQSQDMPDNGVATVIGTTGGVHLLAEPGELIVEIEKRDLNELSDERELRAILVGPDRKVIADKRIDDDGLEEGSGTGPAGHVTIRTDVQRKGVYALNITVSSGQMTTDLIWGFRTNASQFLIESARGHRDEDHEEPIHLRNSEEALDVWFSPPDSTFEIEISDLPGMTRSIHLYDKDGNSIQELDNQDGETGVTINQSADRAPGPWRLSFEHAMATIHIDGLTRWRTGDPHEHLSYWTTSSDAWFPYQDYRWILTPYRQVIYGEPGQSGQLEFRVHNNSAEPRTIHLDAELPDGAQEIRIVPQQLELEGQQQKPITLFYTIPDREETIYLHASPAEDPELSTYSSIELRHGESPARGEVETPVHIRPYEHEPARFGYQIDYPTDWEIYTDPANRPYVRVEGGIKTVVEGEWVKRPFTGSVTSDREEFRSASFEQTRSNSKIAFDQDHDLYMIATTDGRAALLHSSDRGKSFTAYDLGSTGGFDLETFIGHNTLQGPPAILRAITTYEDEEHFWRRISNLELILTEKHENELTIDDPVLISDASLGVGSHSGLAAAIVSGNERTHIIWGEATDPEKDLPGVPTYVTSVDRHNGDLTGEPVLIGYGPPANNVHNRPSITIDSEGYLHALIGTHGQPFRYARSLEPDNAHSGWTDPVELSEEESIRQTYIGLVTGPDDTLHLVYRLWRYGEQPHPASHHAALAYQQKEKGQPWSEPELIWLPPFSEYSIFYHRLGIDRRGALMLSYDYWSTYWFYRNDFPEQAGHHRTTLWSEDGGNRWRFLFTDDFLE